MESLTYLVAISERPMVFKTPEFKVDILYEGLMQFGGPSNMPM